jgi:hypothetical protein
MMLVDAVVLERTTCKSDVGISPWVNAIQANRYNLAFPRFFTFANWHWHHQTMLNFI